MKRGWIALAMIVLALLMGGFEQYYVTANTDAYLSLLDEADARMEDNDIAGAGLTAKRLETRFHKQSGVMNIFQFHSEIGNIESDLAKMRRYAQNSDVTEFLATSACARREILTIRDAKLFKWENIF